MLSYWQGVDDSATAQTFMIPIALTLVAENKLKVPTLLIGHYSLTGPPRRSSLQIDVVFSYWRRAHGPFNIHE